MARRKRNNGPWITEAGDKCDSDYERLIIDNLITRGVEYEFHPGPYEYSRPVRGGFCLDCDSNNVAKGSLYTPDLRLLSSNVIIELKGGSMTGPSRGRLKDFCKYGEIDDLHFLFRDNRTIYTGSKTRHVRWAERMGCTTAVGMEVPESWL
jgi:hypothetical protein